MKKIWLALLSLTLVISLFPSLTSAAQSKKFEQELTQFLKEASTVRGFKITKDDIEETLSYYDESIEDFQSIKELKLELGQIIKADSSNLDFIYKEYSLTKDSLIQLLKDNGEELTDYIFIDDLEESVYFYAEETIERDPNFDKDFVIYLAEVSKKRGFEITEEAFSALLASYEFSLEDFASVKELNEFMGEVIKADLSNLSYFNENFGLDKQALLQLLQDNGEDINDYIYIDDLEETVWVLEGGDFEGDIAEDLLPIFEEELGLTNEELQRIEDHLMSLEERFSDPATIERLESLADRMMAFEEFDVATELTAQQLAEIASIYEELLSIFNLKVTYSLVKNGEESPMSLTDLMKMEELTDANLKIMIYTTDGKFLADLLITSDMVDSDTITNAGQQVYYSANEVKKTIKQAPAVSKQNNKTIEYKTVKGAKLPDTASDYLTNSLIGLFIILLGSLMYRKVRKA